MIRRATSADRDALVRLQAYLSAQNPDLLSVGLRAGNVLVSTVEETVVGYLLAVPGDDVYVAELVVDPHHRREGHGSALLATLLASLPDGTLVTVTTAPDNEAALSLYRSYGFENRGRDPDAYDDGPGVVLARRVGPSDGER